MSWHRAASWLVVWMTGLACHPGSVDLLSVGGDTDDKVTFGALVESAEGTSSAGQSGKPAGQAGESDGTVTADPASPAVEVETVDDVELTIASISRCHAAEVDNMLDRQQRWAQLLGQKQGVPAPKLRVTIETTDRPLGALEVETDTLKSPLQAFKVNVVNRLVKQMQVAVPQSLAGGDEFDAFLFACIDSNDDGSCADERADKMQAWPFRTDVFFFKPLKASVAGGKVSFRAPKLDELSVPFGAPAAAKFMQQLLRNLAGKAVGEQAPLTVVLTVRARKAPECQQQQGGGGGFGGGGGDGGDGGFGGRGGGCFVAGTLITVGEGHRTMPVDRLGTGATIRTAGGAQVRSLASVRGPEEKPVIEIRTTAGHRLAVTDTHPLLTSDGLKKAGELRPDDRLLDADRRPVRIRSLRRRRYDGLVYNFVLPGGSDEAHLVVANGLLAGDLYLQQKLSGGDLPLVGR